MPDPDMLFDLTLKDADVHEALNDFFKTAERPFEIDDDMEGPITVHAADLGFKDALELMLPTGYQATEIDGIYHIRRIPNSA